MNSDTIYLKTEKGDEEISKRLYGLSANLRPVLILVDGLSTVQKIMEKGAGLPNIAQSLAELEKQGFIKRHSFQQLKDELITIARETLGDGAEKVIRKIKDSPETTEELSATIASCKKLVKLAIDEKKAEELEKKCSEIVKRYNL